MNIYKTLYSCEHTEYDVVYTPDVVYAHRPTGDLTLQIVTPIGPDLPREEETFRNPVREKFARWGRPLAPLPKADVRFPLIVDCPGSGWAGADGHRHVPYMVDLARQGFCAASISYRGTFRDDVTFPAAVQDMREAIRYLRANAAAFRIDPDRVGVMGDSSGGNTAAFAAVVPDSDMRFNIGENLDQSAEVKCCCCVYGPVDMMNLVADRIAEGKHLRPEEAPFPEGVPFEALEIWQENYEKDPEAFMRQASPYDYLDKIDKPVPFLFVQGEEDAIIPMAQGLRLCDKLRQKGGRAEFMKIAGAGHGNGVWSRAMISDVIRFFKTYLG
ncbi:MAG: alpha/beta hydrolase [Clostridia bacterium]|nr:alpha/beta hydrolase [Clostridia bacterium]